MRSRLEASLVLLLGCAWLALGAGFLHSLPIWGDGAIFLEECRRVADGAVPHRDFFEVKPALFTLLAAPVLGGGRLAGLPDWLGARLLMTFAGGLLALLAWALGRQAARAAGLAGAQVRTAGLLATAALLSLRGMAFLLTTGVEPKTFVVLFLQASLLLALRGRPLAAGALAPLAAACWQPAALAWPVLLLAAGASGPTPPRPRARFLLGSAATATALLAALLLTDALVPFLEQTLGYSLVAARSGGRSGALREPLRVAFILWHAAGPELLWALPLTLLALLRGGRPARLLFLLPAVFGLWSLLDFQAFPDTQPLVAPVMVLGGIGLGLLLPPRPALAAALLLSVTGLLPGGVPPPWPLAWQRRQAEELVAALPPDSAKTPWLAFGDPALAILADRPTTNRHLFLAEGSTTWLDEHHPGGSPAWIRATLASPAAVLILGRGNDPELRSRLEDALREDGRWRLWRDLSYPAPVTGWPLPLQVWIRDRRP